MAITYIIKSEKTMKFYVGSSHFCNPLKRLKEHNSGKVHYTKPGRPWNLIHFESFKTYTEARKRELFLKTGIGRKWIYNNFRNK